MSFYIILTGILFMTTVIGIVSMPISINKIGNVGLNLKQVNNSRICKCIALIILMFLWTITAFRGLEIGNDTQTYINYFYNISENGVNSNYEIELGYQYFCLLISKINKNPHVFLFLISTILYIGVGIYIFKYSKNILFSVCLFFSLCFSAFTNTLRQNIAMILCLYAFQSIKSKKYIKTILIVGIASCFHYSAWIFLLFFLDKIIPKKRLLVFTASLIISFFGILGVLNYILIFLLPEYSIYFLSEYASSGWIAVSYQVVRNGIFYYFVYGMYRDKIQDNKFILDNFVLLLLCSSLGFVVNLFTRASEYFLLIGVVELPNAFFEGKVKNKQIIIILLCFIMLLYFLVTLIWRPEWNNLYPYKFFWNTSTN